MTIVFLHHDVNNVCLYHYDLIKNNNKNNKIYSIGFEGNKLLPDSIQTCKKIYPKNRKFNWEWTEADLLIYDFYLQRPKEESYFFIEWDTYSNCSVEDYYKDYLDKDLFAPTIFKENQLSDWSWYQKLTPEQKKIEKLGGISPTSCLYFKNNTLKKMTDLLLQNPFNYNDMFSELRLGTLAQQCGFELFESNNKNISWRASDIKINKNKKAFYHPVKHIINKVKILE